MNPDAIPSASFAPLSVRVRPDPAGQYTAEVVGLPAIHATAATREDALAQVRAVAARWVSSGELVSLAIPLRAPVQKPAGWAKDDPLEQEFLDDLAQMRREDLDRTLREYEREDQGCSDTSSTPTT